MTRRFITLTTAVAAALLATAGAARAQAVPPTITECGALHPTGWICGGVFFSTTTTESLVFNTPTTTATTLDAYATTIQGKLVGGSLLYDQTFDEPFGSPAVSSGVAAARLAITTAGGPGVVIAAPRLVSRTVTTTSTTVATYSLDHQADNLVVTTYIGGLNPDGTLYVSTIGGDGSTGTGPNPITVGVLSTCNVTGLPSATKPVCTPTGEAPFGLTTIGDVVVTGPLLIPDGKHTTAALNLGSTIIDTRDDRTDYIDEADAVTTTNLTSETYLVEGTVKPLGTIHVMTPVAAFEDGEGFLDRLSAAGSGSGPWAGVWTGQAKTKADGALPGGSRDSHGVDGGLQGGKGGVTLGVAVSSGVVDLAIPDAGENGRVDLTDVALYAGWRGTRGFVSTAIGGGHGKVATTVSPLGGDESAFAGRDVASDFAGVRAGLVLPLGRATVTPELGFSHVGVRMGELAEAGSDFALRAAPRAYHRDQAWLGAALDLAVTRRLAVQAVVRAANRSGSLGPALPVSFAGAPDAALDLTGPRDKAATVETGVSATWSLSGHATLYAAWDRASSGRVTATTARAGLRLVF